MTERNVRPENWPALLELGKAMKRFAKTADPAEFSGVLISAETLGDALIAIARGKDAQIVFGQRLATRGRQPEGWFRTSLARWYWKARSEGKKHRDACGLIRKKFPDRELTDGTIRKYADELREPSLRRLERAGIDCSRLHKQVAAGSWRGRK